MAAMLTALESGRPRPQQVTVDGATLTYPALLGAAARSRTTSRGPVGSRCWPPRRWRRWSRWSAPCWPASRWCRCRPTPGRAELRPRARRLRPRLLAGRARRAAGPRLPVRRSTAGALRCGRHRPRERRPAGRDRASCSTPPAPPGCPRACCSPAGAVAAGLDAPRRGVGLDRRGRARARASALPRARADPRRARPAAAWAAAWCTSGPAPPRRTRGAARGRGDHVLRGPDHLVAARGVPGARGVPCAAPDCSSPAAPPCRCRSSSGCAS